MEKISCPICHSNSYSVVATKADYTVPFINVICEKCALVYANPVPSRAELEEYYKRGFIQVRHQIQSVDEARERARRKGSAAKYPVAGLRDGLSAGSKVLEIGCSYGFLLKALHDATGCDTQGVEPNEVSGRFATEEFGIPVVHATVEEYLALPTAETYDLIIISHVLEHVADPVAVLTALRPRLKKGGRLYVCVPDVTHLQEPLESFFQTPHVTSFSPWTLHLALQAAGLKILTLKRKLKWPKAGFEVFAAPVSDPTAAAPLGVVLRGSDVRQVKWHLKRIGLQYGILRALKRLVGIIIPKRIIEKASVKLRQWLRAAGDAGSS